MSKYHKGKKNDQNPKRMNKKEAKPMNKKDSGREVVYGKNTVNEVLSSNRKIFEVVVADAVSKNDVKLMDLLAERNITCRVLPKQKFEQVVKDKYDVKGNHQGVLAIVEPYGYLPLADLIQRATNKDEPAFIIILDGLEDPHNLGSIMRTADAAGVHGIIIPRRRAVGLTSVVAKTSTGAIEHVPVARVTNLVQTAKELQERGVWLFGTDMKGKDYRTWDAHGAVALVIGNEGKGISSLLKKTCDEMLTIPMVGHVQSLNASVAASLLIYQGFNSRHPLK